MKLINRALDNSNLSKHDKRELELFSAEHNIAAFPEVKCVLESLMGGYTYSEVCLLVRYILRKIMKYKPWGIIFKYRKNFTNIICHFYWKMETHLRLSLTALY